MFHNITKERSALKKAAGYLGMLAISVLVALGLSACSNDDKDADEPTPDQPTDELTDILCSTAWVNSSDDGFIFKPDGTGFEFEDFGYDQWEITYELNGNILIVDDRMGQIYHYEIIKADYNVLKLKYDDDGYDTTIESYYPTDWEPIATDDLIDILCSTTWVDKNDNGYVFKPNGTGIGFEDFDYDQWDFTYELSGRTIIIEDYDKDNTKEYHYYEIVEADYNKVLKLKGIDHDYIETYYPTDWKPSEGGNDKPDDNPATDPYEGSPILGSWVSTNFDGDTDVKVTLKFYADGSAEEVIDERAYGGEIDTCYGTFEYESNQLTWNVEYGLMYNTFSRELTVKTLTSTKLVIEDKYGASATFKKN